MTKPCSSKLLVISIHALREEGDSSLLHCCIYPWNFYPRPPRGGRPCGFVCHSHGSKISIHALREEGDIGRTTYYRKELISIHALREEGDQKPMRGGIRL